MKDNHHEPPREEPPHGKKPKREKKRGRRHGGLIIVLLLIIIILILLLVLFNPFGWGGGSGFGFGKGNNSSDEGSGSSVNLPDSSGAVSDIVTIEIKDNSITIDGEACADENVLKDKVTDIGTAKKYVLIHDTAIKETYDKVRAVLVELRDALGIEVDLNEAN